MDSKSRARLHELTEDRKTRVVSDGGAELNGLLRSRIAELEAALKEALRICETCGNYGTAAKIAEPLRAALKR